MATFLDLPTRIWLEPLRLDDGRPRYSKRGQLYRCRLGSADGEVLVEGCLTPALDACRILVARGITGPFETWREGVPYACMRGDIEKAAKLDVSEEAHGPVFRSKRQEAASGLVNSPPASAEPIVEHYPPDTTACIFWLNNRQPERWRDRVEVQHQDGRIGVIGRIPTDEEWAESAGGDPTPILVVDNTG